MIGRVMPFPGFNLLVNAIAFCLAITQSQTVLGFESPPPTLRALVKSSTLILVAEVSEVRVLESTATATLAVSQVVKGDRVGEEVIVEFIPGMNCPPSPRYREGEFVLAFLTRHGDHYQTVRMGHGD